MPKPLLLNRPSGLYVRFYVPADLRPQIGSRFVVRPLYLPMGNHARVAAAYMGVAISEVFQRLRKGEAVDLNSALEAAKGRSDLFLGAVTLPSGVVSKDVQIQTFENERQFPTVTVITPSMQGVSGVPRTGTNRNERLAHLTEVHLSDLQRAGRDGKTLLESRHTLNLFLGIVGDKPVPHIDGDDCRLFF
jgi:hypothetical protein